MTTPTVAPHPPDDTADGDCGCPECTAYWASGLDSPFVVLGNTTTEPRPTLDFDPIDDTEAGPAAARTAAYEGRVAEELQALDFEPDWSEMYPEGAPFVPLDLGFEESFTEIGKAARIGKTSEALSEPEIVNPGVTISDDREQYRPGTDLASQWWAPPERFLSTGERRPSALTRCDGATLLYLHTLNWVSGLPACGKSWIGLLVAIASPRSIYVDFEDGPQTLGERSLLLGALTHVQNDSLFRYISGYDIRNDDPDQPAGVIQEAIDWVEDGVVIIDTAGSAGCPMDGSDVRDWLNMYVAPWQRNNATIVVLDHIPKRSEGRAAGPIGSIHKMASVDGACLRVIGEPWNKTTGGHITLLCEKDRHGQLPATAGKAIATIHGSYDDHGGFGYEIVAPRDSDAGLAEVLPLRERILKALSGLGDIGATSGTALSGAVSGRRQDILAEADRMAEEGLIEIDMIGRSYRYRINTDYTETE